MIFLSFIEKFTIGGSNEIRVYYKYFKFSEETNKYFKDIVHTAWYKIIKGFNIFKLDQEKPHDLQT